MPHVQTEHTPGSIADARDGYPAYKQSLARMSDRALSAEYRDMLRATFCRIFGRSARSLYPFVVGELARRGLSR